MPFKVKEHFRKTKSGKLARVKESNRSRVKKGLVVAGTALTTLGLGALAYKRLGSKLVKGAVSVSGKANNVAASKAKDITALVTPKKLTIKAKSYQTLPDPWLDGSTTANKASKALTTGKKETKLLTGSKYQAEDIPDPWNSSVKPKPKLKKKITETKEVLALPGSKYKAETINDPWDDIVSTTKTNKPLTTSKVKKEQLLLTGSKSDYISPTKPSVISVRRNKDLGGEIRSQRTLIRREPKDIVEANKKLELAKRYEASDSPALQRTGASYRKRAEERLTVISSRSPNKKQTGLITTRGNASQGTNRSSNYPKKVREKKTELTVTKAEIKPEPPLSQTTRIPNTNTEDTGKLVTSRRTVLRGLLFGGKQAITNAPKVAADKAKRSLMDTIGDAKWIDDNIQEIGKKGKNVYKRRVVLTKAKNKLVNKAGYELNKDKEGLGQAIDIVTLPGRARRTNRTIKRQSAVIVKQAKKARAALGDPAAYHELTTGERLNAGAKIIRLLGG